MIALQRSGIVSMYFFNTSTVMLSQHRLTSNQSVSFVFTCDLSSLRSISSQICSIGFLSSFDNSLRSVLDHYPVGKQNYHQLDDVRMVQHVSREYYDTPFCPLFLLFLPNRPLLLPKLNPKPLYFHPHV